MKLRYLRWILLPFSLLYGLVVLLRNWAYDCGFFKSTGFELPVIVVGNLAVGGAGKSPMTEYLVRLFKSEYKLAVLSRGYGRQTNGFRWVKLDDDSVLSGDEPLQFKRHFPELSVAVCEDRVAGITRLKDEHELVILDDAFQHRALKPSLQILLFDYQSLKNCDWLLPAGNLRESMSAKGRADILIVTKSPNGIPEGERQKIREKLRPLAHQSVFFSHLKYGDLVALHGQASRKLNTLNNQTQVILLSGIANPKPLLEELKKTGCRLHHQEYPDHHGYSPKNIRKLAAAFAQLEGEDQLIITTEKDAQRLQTPALSALLAELPVFVLPVEADFEPKDQEELAHLLKEHVRSYSKHH